MKRVKVLPGLCALAISIVMAGMMAGLMALPARAEGQSWLQVEAQPTLAKALDRARAYAGDFADVEGYRLSSGWYGVLLGPMTPDDAANRLIALRQANAIPYDSFIADGAEFGEKFWPVGDTGDAAADSTDATDTTAAADTTATDTPEPIATEETQDEALAAETDLPQTDKQALQEALQWYGFYSGTLDGAIGKGTRKSMAAWQEAKGYEATGVLTTAQRSELVDGWKADKSEFGFETVTEAESGIEATLPMGLVEFDSYAPPFVQYKSKGNSGLTIRLLSEPGDAAALSGLYNVLQTLDVMPEGGERALGEDSFTIRGKNDQLESYAFAKSEKGAIKGYLVTWTPALDGKIDRILPVIQSSFRSNGAKALDPGLVPLSEAIRRGLLAGLEAKAARSSQSGLFVSADGAVVTTASAVAQCGKVTIERETPAKIVASDDASGLVLLQPEKPIAPQAYASFAAGLPQKGAQVAAVGWSYGDRLPAPVLNPGLLEATSGLDGSAAELQLALTALDGDAGGPVLDGTGAVIGMVLPGNPAGPALPKGVALAETNAAVLALMAKANLTPRMAADGASPASPDALQTLGLGQTALVSCWE